MSMQIRPEDSLEAQEYPWLRIELRTDSGEVKKLQADPNAVYALLSKVISTQLGGGPIREDAPQEERRMMQAMRTTVKGAFLMFGGKLLDAMFKSKEHPMPGKGDDLIQWYADMLAQISIATASKAILQLHVRGGDSFEQTRPLIIDEIRTISYAEDALTGGAGTDERERARQADTRARVEAV